MPFVDYVCLNNKRQCCYSVFHSTIQRVCRGLVEKTVLFANPVITTITAYANEPVSLLGISFCCCKKVKCICYPVS